ncbi:MAG: hypothetical protein AAFM92_11095 [Pseudomonadota bacterium]
MKQHLLALTVGIAALTLATAAKSQQNCAPRAKVLERLTSGFGETRQSSGLAANRTLVEMYANEDTGTWTLTVTLPNGATCLVATGQSFESMASVAPAAMGQRL